ncbi:DUF115 domain-containing protein [Anaerocolumna sedimenticola]|uniref:DUF115 domain-containing protein n=1 Tax=Anaerocolumna sedimenticola TaxID=2696063 RepID=A0A6P1TK58_9FIRM|nr:6-hydroxymethylpterin diphosphokinase MptE-like protein [Anaerocolumna sedimenticola]QHQ60677.1 DUF115 domain-containing protein [Anaerocolumna sedimenticola]
MSLFENNMKALETHRSAFFHKLKILLVEDNNKSNNDIQLIETKDGNSAFSLTVDGNKYNLNSLYSPVMEAKRWSNQFDFKNLNIVVSMFGLGNGYFARELMLKLKKEDFLLIYEPSTDLFVKAMEHFDLSDIIGNENTILLLDEINGIEFKNVLKMCVNWMNLNSQVICNHPHYDTIFKESYNLFNKAIKDNSNGILVNENTNAATSKLITKNTMNNFKFLKGCNIVTDLLGKIPVDIPAIIVAAGPSLDKNINELKMAKGKAVIFAVDTAVKYLLKNQIIPDFIVTLDPKKSLHHLSDPRCNNIPLICRIEARTENLQRNNKRIIFFNMEGYTAKLLQMVGKDTGWFQSGGSVTTGAFSICKTLGFQTIILVGCDLAYSGKSTHAGGMTVDVSEAGRYLETVEDIYGNEIKTRYDWFIYLRWFEEAITLLNDGEVIDATEGGARIKGTKLMTLKDSINKYCLKNIDVDNMIRELPPVISKEELKIIQESIERDLKELKDIQEKANQGIEICKRLLNKYNKSIRETEGSIEKNKQLSQINNFIEAKRVYILIDWDIAQDTFSYISDLYVYADNEKEDKIYTYEKAKTLYTSIAKAVDRIYPMLETALLSIK